MESPSVTKDSHLGMCQGCAWKEAHNGLFVKLWRLNLNSHGDPKMMEMQKAMRYLLMKAAKRVWNHPQEKEMCCFQQSWKELEIWKSFWHQTWWCSLWCMPSRFLALLWFNIFSLCLYCLWKGSVHPVLLYVRSMWTFSFWFYSGLQLRDHMNLRRDFELWASKCCWSCDILWKL